MDQQSILQYLDRRPVRPLPSLEPRVLRELAQVCYTIGPQISLALEGRRRILVQQLCRLVAEQDLDDLEAQSLRAPLLLPTRYRTLVIVGLGLATLTSSFWARPDVQTPSRLLISSLRALATRCVGEQRVAERAERDSSSLRSTLMTPLISVKDSCENEKSTVSKGSGIEKASAVIPIKRKRSANANKETDSPERLPKKRKPYPCDIYNEENANSEPEEGKENEKKQYKGRDTEVKQDNNKNIGEKQVRNGTAAKVEGKRERKKREISGRTDAQENSVEGTERDSGENIVEGQVKGGRAAKEEGKKERKKGKTNEGTDAQEESVEGTDAQEESVEGTDAQEESVEGTDASEESVEGTDV
ncbi:MAG: hypothetical protein OHK93_003343 [Ramalina farinacea]|uniref:Uncharacterized protein n=1 Tax=Ramalina farinacea TaxID=258253 RepID=A0AA43QVL7_9LECA|nr:hypothetical protein [Ramalina farinacea]